MVVLVRGRERKRESSVSRAGASGKQQVTRRTTDNEKGLSGTGSYEELPSDRCRQNAQEEEERSHARDTCKINSKHRKW